MTLPRNLIDYVHPKGFELRRVNNSGDISWHKGRVFISEVFRIEILGFEQFQEDFYKVYFRDVGNYGSGNARLFSATYS